MAQNIPKTPTFGLKNLTNQLIVVSSHRQIPYDYDHLLTHRVPRTMGRTAIRHHRSETQIRPRVTQERHRHGQ